VDLRVLFLAHPIPGYAILCFLESCFEVDKAICGPDTAALASIRMWHIPNQMNAYKYILSGELLLWWKKELGELQNEIDSDFSNLMSVEIRVHDLALATSQLVKAIRPNSLGFPPIYNRVCECLLYDDESSCERKLS